ncbi:hypothetical protein Ahy_A07g032375 [Arachis hypogaea]|uniref:Helitron helicase-like domain-containing protein n=1 Tax=Arachis hypogaea TaxID=3818 RepID=A0A445C6R9_ARAHY|nr:hypothetical protein Ahy_A07g032375 [Arachis hypogaea]
MMQMINSFYNDILDICNLFTKTFRSTSDRFRNGRTSEIKLRLIRKRKEDGRVYNLPTVSGVIIIIDGFRNGIMTPMQYGIDSTKKRKTISMRELFSFLIQIRVDKYPTQPTKKIRVDKYSTLHESLIRVKLILLQLDRGLSYQIASQVTRGTCVTTTKILLQYASMQGTLDLLFTNVCIVEFQKRGLPHVHILLFIHPLYKPKSPVDIDKLISTEILDKFKRLKVYATVKKFIVYGQHGRYNNNSPCMSNGRSSKYYPKVYPANEAGFPKYRRSDNKMIIMNKDVVLGNSYIVLYNLALLLKYRCHINVEHTSHVYNKIIAFFYQTKTEGEIE